MVKVVVTYQMVKQGEVAENFITLQITNEAYNSITGQKVSEINSALRLTVLLEGLVRLQGYRYLKDWSIELIEVAVRE